MQANSLAIITNKLSHGSKCFTMQLKQPRSTARAKHCSSAEGSNSEVIPAHHRHTNFENTLPTPTKGCKSMSLDIFVGIMCLTTSVIINKHIPNSHRSQREINQVLTCLAVLKVAAVIASSVTVGHRQQSILIIKSIKCHIHPSHIQLH